jgi:hypothetical protein
MLFILVPLPVFIFFIAAMPMPIPRLEEPILFAAAPIDARLLILLLFMLFILPSPPKAGVDVVVVSCGRGACDCACDNAPGGGARLKPEKLEVVGPVLAPGGGGRENVGVRFWVGCCCWLRESEPKADVDGCCCAAGGDDHRLLLLLLLVEGVVAPQLMEVV